ncbi:MAG: acyl-CoA dehydrogenase family protein [Deltaproteobacteria bacterium]|nr:acyl-CoA dehydrogenase family protein [Deltaproteobacteria bacterium]
MNFDFTEEAIILRDSTKRFVEKELRPIQREVEESGQIPDHVLAKMKELGYFGLTIPAEYGGSEISLVDYALVIMELSKTNYCYNMILLTHNGIGSHGIVRMGSPEQKAKYLPRMATGELVAAFALTEPNAGCDAAAIQTTAVKDGDSYVLNGRKQFITNGPIADVFTVMAYTDKSKGYKGMTAFIVEKDTPGFFLGRTHETMGGHGCHEAELIFEDCRVSAEAVLGQEGQGFISAMKILDEGRIDLGAVCVGASEYILDLSLDYAKQRVQFGKPIAENQAIQWMLADMDTEIYAAKMMLLNAAWLYDQGQRITHHAARLKLFASEMFNRVADRGVQIHGGMGWMRESPVEWFYRDSRITRIVEGTSEIMRMVISRSLLR